ncbi:hypothetical protein [Candidatus Viridilinea mediisalina]|uniref:hypothetical protein n=1 Tax=Candidatus Viridilinea mediisalina TaxID=2024553 RepID=UPI000F5A9AC8|nr:hypothetical protein [Candidatus Viridilinea mediisalina]
MLGEDEHAPPGAGLLGCPLGEPAMVWQDGVEREGGWTVGLAGLVALHGHRLPRSDGVGQGGLQVVAERVFAARFLDDRLALVD